MKRITFALIIILVLSGCDYKIVKVGQETKTNQVQQAKSDNDIFKKKQECEKYLEKANSITSENSMNGLDPTEPEIFYSPQKNSCLTYYTTRSRNLPIKDTIWGYMIVDLLTNETVYQKLYLYEEYNSVQKIDDASNDFNKKIEELKK